MKNKKCLIHPSQLPWEIGNRRLKLLKETHDQRVQVAKSRQFVGFDAYQDLIESGVDVVLLASPPGFRPKHLSAAIDANKHVFYEKPVAVDAPGVRKVLEAAKKDKEKNLSMVSGFCFRYDLQKKANKAKKKQRIINLKEIKLRPVTEIHDYNFKIKNAQKFLKKGDKVKFTVQFRGREMQHTNLGYELMKRITNDTISVGKVEISPKIEGRQIIMIIQPL